MFKGEELVKRIQEFDTGVITETKHKRNDHLYVLRYNAIMKNSYNNKGGAGEVAIIVSRTIK